MKGLHFCLVLGILTLFWAFVLPPRALAFSENFNGSLGEATKWNLFSDKPSLIYMTESGVGYAKFYGVSQDFSYISVSDLNPDIADRVTIRFKSDPKLSSQGAGMAFSDNVPDENTIDSNSTYIFKLQVAGNQTYKFVSNVCGDGQTVCSQTPIVPYSWNQSSSWDVVEIRYVDNHYEVFKNGEKIFNSSNTNRRISGIWIGNPEHTTQPQNWPVFYIDYITVNADEGVTPTPTAIPTPTPTPTPIPTATPTPIPTATPTPTPIPTRSPIILIPGHGATWDLVQMGTGLPTNQWSIPSFLKIYDNLIASLKNAGYVEGQDLWIFGYDWRKNLQDLSVDLNSFINGLNLNNEQVVLLGHSYGGLVSRSYAQNYGSQKIKQIVSIGVPNLGAVNAYGAWEGAELWDHPLMQRVILATYLLKSRTGGQSEVQNLRKTVPSIKDLLPTHDYLVGVNGLIPETTMKQRNISLSNLNNQASSVDSILSAIAGNTMETNNQIYVKPRSWVNAILGRWEDGEPTGWNRTDAGDGSVDRVSALANFTNHWSMDLNHQDLIFTTEGIGMIFDRLGLDQDKISIVADSYFTGNQAFVAILNSPGILKLVDQFGVDISDDIEIPEAKMIIWPNPTFGNYRVVVENNGEVGDYKIDLTELGEGLPEWKTIGGSLNGEDDEYPIVISDEVEILSDEKSIREGINYYLNKLGHRKPWLNLLVRLNKIRRAKEWLHDYHYWAIKHGDSAVEDATRNLLTVLDEWSVLIARQETKKDNGNDLVSLNRKTDKLQDETEKIIRSNQKLPALNSFLLGKSLNTQADLDIAEPMVAREEYYSAQMYFDEAKRY